LDNFILVREKMFNPAQRAMIGYHPEQFNCGTTRLD